MSSICELASFSSKPWLLESVRCCTRSFLSLNLVPQPGTVQKRIPHRIADVIPAASFNLRFSVVRLVFPSWPLSAPEHIPDHVGRFFPTHAVVTHVVAHPGLEHANLRLIELSASINNGAFALWVPYRYYHIWVSRQVFPDIVTFDIVVPTHMVLVGAFADKDLGVLAVREKTASLHPEMAGAMLSQLEKVLENPFLGASDNWADIGEFVLPLDMYLEALFRVVSSGAQFACELPLLLGVGCGDGTNFLVELQERYGRERSFAPNCNVGAPKMESGGRIPPVTHVHRWHT